MFVHEQMLQLYSNERLKKRKSLVPFVRLCLLEVLKYIRDAKVVFGWRY